MRLSPPCLQLSFFRCLQYAVAFYERDLWMQVNVVPYLIDNPSIGFVQARWTFTNPEESYLTKAGRLCLLLV